ENPSTSSGENPAERKASRIWSGESCARSVPIHFASSRGICLPIQRMRRRFIRPGRLTKYRIVGRLGVPKFTYLGVTLLMNFEWRYDFRLPLPPVQLQPKPVVPKLAPRSLTRYLEPRLACPSSIALFSSFRSQLFTSAIITRRPLNSRVLENGFCFQRHLPIFFGCRLSRTSRRPPQATNFCPRFKCSGRSEISDCLRR